MDFSTSPKLTMIENPNHHDHIFYLNIMIPIILLPTLALSITMLVKLLLNRKSNVAVYLVDYSCHKPKPSLKISKEAMLERMRRYMTNFTDETIEFSRKMLERSGPGPVTYGPEALVLMDPPDPCLAKSRSEAEESMFGSVDQLLAKAGVDPAMIGIVVVNCCVFNSVPSLADMIVNRYKLREDVVCYSISGMGCSAGLLAVGLVRKLLQVHKDTYALVVSTEIITENFYKGNNRAMLLINYVFRVGGCAILLSNRPSDRQSSKYELVHNVHTYNASCDRSYSCISMEEDAKGFRGILVTKDLLVAALETIEANLTTLGPLILPTLEQLRFATNCIMRKLNMFSNGKPYIPNFKGSVDQFFCHVGTKPVLDELQKKLKMSNKDMEPSRMTLYRWGNTSSSSIWYELAYSEAKGRVKKGDRVWHIAFGSGFKCSSIMWRALRDVEAREALNPWSDEIDRFPVELKIGEFPNYFDTSHA